MIYNLKMLYFICSNAKQINLDEALHQGVEIQIEDLYKYAFEFRAVDLDGETGRSYLYENYRVVMGMEKCIIDFGGICVGLYLLTPFIISTCKISNICNLEINSMENK